MKKRIFTLFLAVALLVTFIPAAALSASAVSELAASQEMIDVLKRWEGFSSKPYWDNSQWTVGYGTRVPDDKLEEYRTNGISEEEAEALLQEFLVNMGAEIIAFAEKNGLSLTQGQFDGMLSLSFNCGTGWLYSPSTLRTSVLEGWTGDDLLFAFAQWSNSGGKVSTGHIRRRLAEAQMYLDGVYDIAPSADYSYVIYNACGGKTNITVQGYDVNAEPALRAVPTYNGLVFAGWYTDPTGGELVTKLDATVKTYTLYAHWTAEEGEGTPGEEAPEEEITGTAVNYERQVVSGNLHAFAQPVKGSIVVASYSYQEVLQIVAEYTDSNSVKWGKVKEGGWVNLGYTTEFNPGTETEGDGIEVTVTATDVNLRRGPGTSYAVIGMANRGDVLNITQTANGSGYFWGKSEKGWIALKYTNYDEVTKEPENPEQPEQPENPEQPEQPENPEQPEEPKPVATGKVKIQSGYLNVRSGAGTQHGVVGKLYNGDAVEIFETKKVGATEWGRIAQGWVSMTYIELDEAVEEPEQPEKPENPEQPENPVQPENPEKPENPEQPENPEKPEQPKPETGKVVVSSGVLNIRSGPGTNYAVVGYLSAGEAVTITEQKTVNGTNWGKIAKGWVCMKYIALDPKDENEEATVRGIVSAGGNRLRVRTGPGTNYAICAYLEDGVEVEILEQRMVDGTNWGRVEQGWINMSFVKLHNAAPTPEKPSTIQGIVTATCLHIRQNAGTNYAIVGRLYTGDRVTILEVKDVNGVQWGRIDSGWICMTYIKKV